MSDKAPTFEGWLEKKLRDPGFRRGFQREQRAAQVALKIARLRHRAGLSQRQLAGRMGTSQQAVARLEGGDYDGFTFKTLQKVADALGAELTIDLKCRAV